MVGGMSYHNPPPHPHDDTSSEAIENPLRLRFVFWPMLTLMSGWIIFGWYVFAPWFVDVSGINADPELVRLCWVIIPPYLVLYSTVWAAHLIGRVRARSAVTRPD